MSGLIKKNNEIAKNTKSGMGLIKTNTQIAVTDQNKDLVIAKPDQAFVEHVVAMKNQNAIGYVFDATASREDSWETAKIDQEKLLRQGYEMNVRLVHFGGSSIKDTGWHKTPRPLIDEMNRTSCQMGMTQIIPSLEKFLRSNIDPKIVMLVGDSYEEDFSKIDSIVRSYIKNGTRIFAYQEGDDAAASQAFKELAKKTEGVYLKLGDNAADINLSNATSAAIAWVQDGDSGLLKLAESGNKAAKQIALLLK
jgi:hypothetical protein